MKLTDGLSVYLPVCISALALLPINELALIRNRLMLLRNTMACWILKMERRVLMVHYTDTQKNTVMLWCMGEKLVTMYFNDITLF